MAEQVSQEGHLFRIQHFLWSRVSAHVIQEDGNVGCIICITSCFWSLLWAQMCHMPWALLPPFSSYPWRDHPSGWLSLTSPCKSNGSTTPSMWTTCPLLGQ